MGLLGHAMKSRRGRCLLTHSGVDGSLGALQKRTKDTWDLQNGTPNI